MSRWACLIEDHYGRPMDMEWAKDGETGALFIVQARPETVQSRREASALKSYRIGEKGRRICTGLAIGDAAATGKVCVIEDVRDIGRFIDGAILVTRTTDPDWAPIMKRAAAIVTEHGGRTSHAAIVSRELGLPAIVGAPDATRLLHDEQIVTLSCAEGDRDSSMMASPRSRSRSSISPPFPTTRVDVMLNLADPAAAFRWWRLPSDGVGLARMEFVINNHIKIDPMALVHDDSSKDEAAKKIIAEADRRLREQERLFRRRAFAGARPHRRLRSSAARSSCA